MTTPALELPSGSAVAVSETFKETVGVASKLSDSTVHEEKPEGMEVEEGDWGMSF